MFDEAGTRCNANQCAAAFISTPLLVFVGFPVHDDFVFGDGNIVSFPSESSPTGPIVGSARARPNEVVWDDGSRKYAGTLVLDIPAAAAGHVYTLNVREGSETMAVAGEGSDDGLPPLVDVPIAQTTSAVLKIGMDSVSIDADRCRFLSFKPGLFPEQKAIRVRLVSLHHVNPPYTGGPSVPFASFEGQYRWVGPPTQYVESTGTNVPLYASSLQCTPHYQDWSSLGYLHVTGSAIVPSSQYDLQFVPASCVGNEDACADISSPLSLATTRWGDIELEFNPPAGSAQPDFGDVAAMVNKFKSAPGAPIKARALLAGDDAFGNISPSTLGLDLSFSHISACVDSFRGKPYPFSIQSCP